MRQVFKSKGTATEEINLGKILDLFRKRWYYVVIAVALSLIFCKLYLRYARPVFVAKATVRVEQDKSMGQGLGMMESFGFGMFRDNIQSEIQLLRSRSMIEDALQEMDINTLYYLVGTLITAEMYMDDTPFVTVYDTSSQVKYGQMFSVFYLGGNKYKLNYGSGPEPIEEKYYFGEKVNVDGFEFRILKRETKKYKLTPGIEYKWKAIRQKDLVGRAMGGLKIEQSGYMVPILNISSEDNVSQFTADFLNTLVEVYQRKDRERKTRAATQALDFIHAQIDTIQQSVEKSEIILRDFKKDRKFVDVEMKVGYDLDKVRENESAKTAILIRQMQIDRLQEQLLTSSSELTLPYSLAGNSDPVLSSLLSSYNSIVQEKIAAMQIYTPDHPKVQEINIKMGELRESVKESVSSVKRDIDEQMGFYTSELGRAKSSLEGIPETQRVFQSLLREYEVKENILLTLLEKEAEAKSRKPPSYLPYRFLDRALPPQGPVSPQPRKIYIIGVGLGCCMGLLFILLAGMLKNTITYREEIENLSITPIVGVVRRANESLKHKYPKLLSVENPKSSLSESIRSIRTNLQFISSGKDTKIIATTSTVSGEGKSFITINLGGMISLLGKKVVVLDLDLRKPKLHFSFGSDNSAGVSTYLAGASELEDILKHTEYDNFDIITSGPIPPNPSELIQSDRMDQLLELLKKEYDYILIDTPPIGLVTDGTTLLKIADVALYVIRSDYSKKSFAQNPDRLTEDQDIRNMYIVFNSVSTAGRRYGGYGYKVYGSGYYSDDYTKDKWWEFWKRFKRS